MPSFALERAAGSGEVLVAGIDEAGRGPLAGPVVAAAVVFERPKLPRELARAIDDSKQLTGAERRRLAPLIAAHGRVGIGWASVGEIDSINILRASLLAMRRAMEQLDVTPAIALVDGNVPPPLHCPVRTVVDGDSLSLSIAAASIIAKVTRDRIMTGLGYAYPGYGWQHNAGYGTPEHQAAIGRLGLTPQHRRSFRPISQLTLPNI